MAPETPPGLRSRRRPSVSIVYRATPRYPALPRADRSSDVPRPTFGTVDPSEPVPNSLCHYLGDPNFRVFKSLNCQTPFSRKVRSHTFPSQSFSVDTPLESL